MGATSIWIHELRNCGLNEAINFETSTIFVAVPKTGTTSIRDQTREQRRFLLKRPHLNIREIRKGIDFYFLSQALDRNRSFPTDPALVPSTTEALDKAAAFYENAFKFASVRNPWARTASLFFRSEGMKCSKNMDFSHAKEMRLSIHITTHLIGFFVKVLISPARRAFR